MRRVRRPPHDDGQVDGQPATGQARRPARHRDGAGRRIPEYEAARIGGPLVLGAWWSPNGAPAPHDAVRRAVPRLRCRPARPHLPAGGARVPEVQRDRRPRYRERFARHRAAAAVRRHRARAAGSHPPRLHARLGDRPGRHGPRVHRAGVDDGRPGADAPAHDDRGDPAHLRGQPPRAAGAARAGR
jgi:hypothetical protein